jgi:hypothetical protein
MADLLKLQKDEPAIIALAFAEGKIVESTIPNAPNQVMFTLCDGRRTFLPLIAADKIREAGIRAREEFEIVKLGPHSYRVRKLDSGPYVPPPYEERAAPASSHASAARVTGPSTYTTNNGNTSAPPSPARPAEPARTITPAAACMCAAMCSAVDAIVETQAYATRKGIGLTFSEESVCKIGLSIYIDNCRNGGAR